MPDINFVLPQRLKERRVLLIEPDEAYVNGLAIKLRNLGLARPIIATFDMEPMKWAQDFDPELIFVAHKSLEFDGPVFTKALRRSDLPCRKAPAIMIAPLATRDNLTEARNAGIDEVILKPFADKDLVERIVHVLDKPRPWIEAMAYIGPDRRRFNSGQYHGPSKRGTKRAAGHLAEVEQSVRIIKSAVVNIDIDRHQALRSITAQMNILVANARVLSDPQFTSSVSQLLAVLKSPQPTRAALLPILSTLVKFLNI